MRAGRGAGIYFVNSQLYLSEIIIHFYKYPFRERQKSKYYKVEKHFIEVSDIRAERARELLW